MIELKGKYTINIRINIMNYCSLTIIQVFK